MVSKSSPSGFGSCNASKRRCHVPILPRRSKRRNTECHGPKRCHRLRQRRQVTPRSAVVGHEVDGVKEELDVSCGTSAVTDRAGKQRGEAVGGVVGEVVAVQGRRAIATSLAKDPPRMSTRSKNAMEVSRVWAERHVGSYRAALSKPYLCTCRLFFRRCVRFCPRCPPPSPCHGARLERIGGGARMGSGDVHARRGRGCPRPPSGHAPPPRPRTLRLRHDVHAARPRRGRDACRSTGRGGPARLRPRHAAAAASGGRNRRGRGPRQVGVAARPRDEHVLGLRSPPRTPRGTQRGTGEPRRICRYALRCPPRSLRTGPDGSGARRGARRFAARSRPNR